MRQYYSTMRDSVTAAVNYIAILHFAIHRLVVAAFALLARNETRSIGQMVVEVEIPAGPEPRLAIHGMVGCNNNPPVRVITVDRSTDRGTARIVASSSQSDNDSALLRATLTCIYSAASAALTLWLKSRWRSDRISNSRSMVHIRWYVHVYVYFQWQLWYVGLVTCSLTLFSGFYSAELDVGPVFLTRPTSEVSQPDLTQNWHETLDPTQPDYLCTIFSFAISCRILQLVHQITFQLRCQHHRCTSHCLLSKKHVLNVGINN